jgi:heme O synthase-like polyprenyltransferase
VVASLLLGLVGGVVGGVAALAGWTAATRRRLRQPASIT